MVIGSFFQDLDDEVGNGPAILANACRSRRRFETLRR